MHDTLRYKTSSSHKDIHFRHPLPALIPSANARYLATAVFLSHSKITRADIRTAAREVFEPFGMEGKKQNVSSLAQKDDDEDVIVILDDVDLSESGSVAKSKVVSPSSKKTKGNVGDKDFRLIVTKRPPESRKNCFVCIKLLCYIVFMAIFFTASFFSSNIKESFYFQSQLREIFHMQKVASVENKCSPEPSNLYSAHSLSKASAFFTNYILNNTAIADTRQLLLATPLKDDMTIFLGGIMVREFRSELNKNLKVPGINTVCSDGALNIVKNLFHEACTGPYSTREGDQKTSDRPTLNFHGQSGMEYSGTKGSKFIKLRLRDTMAFKNIEDAFDLQTRAVVFEWNMYNANTDLFAAIRMVFEVLPSGKFVVTDDIICTQLFAHRSPLKWSSANFSEMTYFACVVEYILLVWAMIYFLCALVKWCAMGTYYYFSDVFRVLPLINCAFFLATATINILGVISLEENLPKMLKMGADDYLDLYTSSYYFQLKKSLNSVNGFFLVLNVFQYLRGNIKIRMLIVGAAHAARDMLIFIPGVLGIILVGFSVAFHLTYGGDIERFSDIRSSLFALVGAYTGDFDLKDMNTTRPFVGTFLCISYVAVAFVTLTAIFFSVADAAYDDAMRDLDEDEEFNEDIFIVCVRVFECLLCPCKKIEDLCQATCGKCLRKLSKTSKPKLEEIDVEDENVDGPSDTVKNIATADDSPRKMSSIFPSLFAMKTKANKAKEITAKRRIGGKRKKSIANMKQLGGGQSNTSVDNFKLIAELKDLLSTHHTVQLSVGADGKIYLQNADRPMSSSDESSSDVSLDEGNEIAVNEFADNKLVKTGMKAKRKALKRERAADSKKGPRLPKSHPYDAAFDDYSHGDNGDDHV